MKRCNAGWQAAPVGGAAGTKEPEDGSEPRWQDYPGDGPGGGRAVRRRPAADSERAGDHQRRQAPGVRGCPAPRRKHGPRHRHGRDRGLRSEEHTSELQSLMRISYAVFCLKKKTHTTHQTTYTYKHTSIEYIDNKTS